jgi:hypothetical protein
MSEQFQYDLFLSDSANDKPVVHPLSSGTRQNSHPSTFNSQHSRALRNPEPRRSSLLRRYRWN